VEGAKTCTYPLGCPLILNAPDSMWEGEGFPPLAWLHDYLQYFLQRTVPRKLEQLVCGDVDDLVPREEH
jgi:hypothetical protein